MTTTRLGLATFFLLMSALIVFTSYRTNRCGHRFSTDDGRYDLACDRAGVHLIHRDQHGTKFVWAPGGAYVTDKKTG